MSKLPILIFLIFVLILYSGVYFVGAVTIVDNCTDLNKGNEVYLLANDIVDETKMVGGKPLSACFYISANNVTLDCQGHVIDGTDHPGRYGIVAYDQPYVDLIKIRNCVVSDWRIGLWFRFCDECSATNMTFLSNKIGYNQDSGANSVIDGSFAFNNTDSGFRIFSHHTFTTQADFHDLVGKYNNYGINLQDAGKLVIRDSKFMDNHGAGIKLVGNTGQFKNVHIYNNLLNNTNNTLIEDNSPKYFSYWNTTKREGDRIYSYGINIGGNYWATPSGDGYSEVCANGDGDRFCDQPYVLVNKTHIDNLPLTFLVLCEKQSINCRLVCPSCPSTGLENCEYIWKSDCGFHSGFIGSGEPMPWLPCNKLGTCVLVAGDQKSGQTTTTTTTTTTVSITTTTDGGGATTTTTILDGLVKIIDKNTTSCYHAIKRECTDEYEYCVYDWNSECNDKEGMIMPSEKPPWMVCNKLGTCKLMGKLMNGGNGGNGNGGDQSDKVTIFEGNTTSCYHKSGKKCPEKFDFCVYNWISECYSISGNVDSGGKFPWMTCYKPGFCHVEGLY